MIKALPFGAFLLGLGLMINCGGGGSGSSNPSKPNPPGPGNVWAHRSEGAWKGSLRSANGREGEAQAFFLGGGKAVIVLPGYHLALDRGQGKALFRSEGRMQELPAVIDLTEEVSKSTLKGTFKVGSEQGTFAFTYLPELDKALAMTDLTGDWHALRSVNISVGYLQVGADGGIMAKRAQDPVVDGRLEIPNPSRSIVTFTLNYEESRGKPVSAKGVGHVKVDAQGKTTLTLLGHTEERMLSWIGLADAAI
jgi:hypothetical protein